jgi:glyoxylate utilization-related uncharacterized protein
VSAFDVLDLRNGRVVDLGTHLAGRWGPTRLLEVPEGDSRTFGDDASESCLFLIDGTADVALDGVSRTVGPGTGVTLVRGTRAVLTATHPVRLFLATLTA